MNAVGIIFADNIDVDIPELTSTRTLASLPFGAKYRIIDFVLSNITNAGIRHVGIVTNSKYASLMGHVRSGLEWDLDRKQGGLQILPPLSYNGKTTEYDKTFFQALKSKINFLEISKEDYVICCFCNSIGNIDLNAMMKYHIEKGSFVTAMFTKTPKNKRQGIISSYYNLDENNKITEIVTTDDLLPTDSAVATNTFIIKRKDLINLLNDLDTGKYKTTSDVFRKIMKSESIYGYETKNPILYFDNVVSYLKSSLSFLNKDIRKEFFLQENRPIITRVGDSAPAWYGKESKVENSIIAAETIIEGEVKNSIIFRGVHIKKGALVENSVVMRYTTIGEDAHLNYCIIDKNVIIHDRRMLSGYITHPFVVEYGAII